MTHRDHHGMERDSEGRLLPYHLIQEMKLDNISVALKLSFLASAKCSKPGHTLVPNKSLESGHLLSFFLYIVQLLLIPRSTFNFSNWVDFLMLKI